MSDAATEGGALPGLLPRERLAVSGLFLANGFFVGSWAPRIPSFKADLGISEGTLGLMILAFGLGSLVAMPLVGMIVAREGSRRVAVVGAFATAPLMALISLAPGIWAAAAALALTGALVGGVDVAMNANAVAVERRMGRAIMSSCHGFWSLGGLIGSASGGVLIGRAGVWGHAAVVLVAILAVAALASLAALRDAPEAAGPEKGARWGGAARAALLPAALLGIVALFSMTPEGAVLDWSALYLRQELGGSVEAAGLAFAGFSATMALMRFSGDLIRDRFGAVTTLRVSTLVAGAGMLLAAFADGVAGATLGFAVAGLGIANMVPIAFSAAGNLPGLPPGIGISMVTFMGYSGLLFAPSLIGFIAEHTGLAAIFAGLPALYIVVLALSGLARWADPAER
ncbi:MFS transporter [Amaricoccus sp.]|uniref:MFS transporter n=1 Tax=Amaricoccus sp. TaxID=1872485 RepID=UPI001B7AB927|nr:MFS transporter [Amaricoccus sp.]MBP7002727.1 MFS transporter [Amaricoccus sp.]